MPLRMGGYTSAYRTRSARRPGSTPATRGALIGGMDPLAALFQNLDRWRHLPGYQLERRADVFFSVYLRGLVEEVSGTPLDEVLLPELPIKRDLVWTDVPTEKSVKVDYVLFSRDRAKVYFVELKTDAGSRRDEQDHYLEAAKRLGFAKIVDGVCSIIRKTTAHQKYHHLVSALAKLGYLTMPDDIRAYLYPAPRPGLSQRLARIVPTGADASVEVLYVQPEATDGDRCIDFEQFAAFVDRHDDPLSRMFAAHLRRWRTPAGRVEPI